MAFTIYAPLCDFDWNGQAFEIDAGVIITNDPIPAVVEGLADDLAKPEWDRASNVGHWLRFGWDYNSPTRKHEILNLVLLSLWIANPTQTRVEFSFKVADDDHGPHSVTRHLDRFQYIIGKVFVPFNDQHLQRASFLFKTLLALYLRNGRLNPALLLTLTGCWSIEWSTALICHAAAAEGLLTYATGPGITRRLSTTFACFMHNAAADRDNAYQHFRSLYDARSDIMHGRVHNIPVADRLAKLDAWQDALRALWGKACDTPAMMTALESTDDDRRLYFHAIAAGYTSPP